MELRPPEANDASALARLFSLVAEDGEEHLSEHKAERVGAGVPQVEVLAATASEVIGYAQAAWHRHGDDGGHWAVEIAVADEAAVAASLIEGVVARLDSSDRWVFWGRRETGRRAAMSLGLVETRAIHRLEVVLPIAATVASGDDVLVVPFRPGRDEAEWIRVNNAAFSDHPENGAVTPADLAVRFDREWFDPAGLLMAWSDGRLLGSCWTKRPSEDRGEIYIIGVHPEAQGRGLGRWLVVEGLAQLHSAGAVTGSLWVEASNASALRLYTSLGFSPTATIRQYEQAQPSAQPNR